VCSGRGRVPPASSSPPSWRGGSGSPASRCPVPRCSATVSASTDTVPGLADHGPTALTAGAGHLALEVVVTLVLVLHSGVAEHRLGRAAADGQPEPAQLDVVDGVPRPGPPALTAAGTGS
jgi:hypothetical protein